MTGRPKTYARIQRNNSRLVGQHLQRAGRVWIVTDERKEANGQTVNILIDAFQVGFHQLSHRQLATFGRVDQRACSFDEHRNAIREHACGQQGVLALECLLQVANDDT